MMMHSVTVWEPRNPKRPYPWAHISNLAFKRFTCDCGEKGIALWIWDIFLIPSIHNLSGLLICKFSCTPVTTQLQACLVCRVRSSTLCCQNYDVYRPTFAIYPLKNKCRMQVNTLLLSTRKSCNKKMSTEVNSVLSEAI